MSSASPDPSAALAQLDIFSSLDAASRSRLSQRLEILTLSDGQPLPEGAPALYIVLSGGLRRIGLEDGSEPMPAAADLEPGQAFGSLDPLTPESREEAHALGRTLVARLGRAALSELADEHPEAADELLRAAARRSPRASLCFALHLSRLFGELGEVVLGDLLQELELVRLRGGETLFRQGESGDTLYIVISGRLGVLVDGPGREPSTVAEIGCGQTVGEMALVSGEPRSATVRTLRDSHLARLPREGFERVLAKHPIAMTRNIAGRLAVRLRQQTSGGSSPRDPITTIAVVPLGSETPIEDFSICFSKALSRLGRTLRLSSASVDQTLGKPSISQSPPDCGDSLRLVEWLSSREIEHRFLVYQADRTVTEWTRRAIRQADHVLLVADARLEPSWSRYEIDRAFDADAPARRSLVLLHPDETRQPSGTRRWLGGARLDRHYHVRLHDTSDYDRLSRILAGKALGLTLGGGFARGLAHIGVIRALTELGISIDLIGGSSMGAIIGAQWAQGWDYEAMTSRTSRGCAESFNDVTFPFVAFHRGRKFSRVVQEFSGDTQIEDLWTPFFCVSANLNRAELKVHTEGSLGKALLATTRAPGVFPPIVYEGELHVDGGVLNNVPVDIMRGFSNGGIVMGVDVSPPHELNPIDDYGVDVGGWGAFWGRFNPFTKSRTYMPSILLVLMRTLEFSGISIKESLARQSDLYIRPPLLGFKRTDFHLAHQITEVGYSYALERVREWLAGREGSGRRPRVRAGSAEVSAGHAPRVMAASREGPQIVARPYDGTTDLIKG